MSFFIFVCKLSLTFLNCIEQIISSKSFSKLCSLFIGAGCCFDLKTKVSFLLTLISLLLVLLLSLLPLWKKDFFYFIGFITLTLLVLGYFSANSLNVLFPFLYIQLESALLYKFRSQIQHSKNVINGKKPTNVKCNSRNTSACPLDGNCQ